MDASKINLFVSWKPDRIDSEVENKKRMDDPESLRQLGQKLEAVQRVWKSYIVDASRGEILPRVGDGVDRGQLPADCLAGLEKVRQQAGQWLQSDVSMGVGMSMQEADRALQISRFRGGDAITLWDEETMQPELEEAHKKAGEEAVKDLSKAGEDAPGPKETPKNKGNAGGGFSGRSEPGAEEKPMAPIPEGSEHSMGEVAAREMSARPAAEGTHSGDLEEEFHDHAQAQEQGDQEAAEAQNRYADTRAKVVQILQQVKAAAPQLEQLKQQAPGLYQVLMEMTQALILTGKALLESEQADAQEDPNAGEVQKNERLNKAWEDPKTEASMAVFQDAAMEGRGQELGTRPIPMPPGKSKGVPTARPRPSRMVDPPMGEGFLGPQELKQPGWELTAAATRRTVNAAHGNERTPTGAYRGGGAEPAFVDHNIFANGGQPVTDRDHRGGYQGYWGDAIEEAQNQAFPIPEHEHVVARNSGGVGLPNYADQCYWGDAIEEAQNQAFPIPEHEHVVARNSGGVGLPNYAHQYEWRFDPGHPARLDDEGNERDPAKEPSWGIAAHAAVKHPADEGYRGQQHWAGFFNVDPQTGLTGEHLNPGGYDEGNMRAHLDKFLASLNGMHKKEMEAALEKGKLPLPENAPKHTHVTWPTGWTKGDGKIKVQHPEDGKTTWVSVRAGQVLSNDGHAISSRNPEGR